MYIFGWGLVGQYVVVKSSFGFKCIIIVKDNGCYDLCVLLMGIYMVLLMKGDQVVDIWLNILLIVGCGVEVDFVCEYDQCVVFVDGYKLF